MDKIQESDANEDGRMIVISSTKLAISDNYESLNEGTEINLIVNITLSSLYTWHSHTCH